MVKLPRTCDHCGAKMYHYARCRCLPGTLTVTFGMAEKPLFIPLRTYWFNEFASGDKDTEYRAYGPRWNERTCRVGREAVISHGYSGARINRRVAAFLKLTRAESPPSALEIYPNAEFIAAIYLPAVNQQLGRGE